MKKIFQISGLMIGLVMGWPSVAAAQDSTAVLRTLMIDDFFAIKQVGDPQISPDGA